MNGLFAKFTGINGKGESWPKIMGYWLPELISQSVLFSLPLIIDSLLVAQLGAITYGALGMGNNFIHTLNKLAESIPVAAIAVIGRHNGAQKYEKCGEDLGDTFWTTFILGFTQFLLIFFAASSIYRWLGVPEEMVAAGAPFLTLKSFGVFLAFIFLGLVGFMRAVKNTRIPMILYSIGAVVFAFTDYVLVLGKFGFPKLGLMGSSWALTLQYGVSALLALAYILINPDYKKYFERVFFISFNPRRMIHLLNLSWPIIIDKSTIAWSYVWLSKMIASLGQNAIVAFDTVKNLERFAFLPTMASATIITFMVSNSLGAKDSDGAMVNIKKCYLLTFLTVTPLLIILCINAPFFISFFDPSRTFTYLAAAALPVISLMVVFDFTQVFLAGALRGAGDFKAVMIGRLIVCLGFFFPISYVINHYFVASTTTKFILIYGSFYITTGIIGLLYLYRVKSHKWQKQNV